MEAIPVHVETYRNIQASRYMSVAGLVMLLYDHILCFDDEVDLIWKAHWTIPKTIFLFLRYVVPLCLVIHMHQLSGLSGAGLDDLFCKIWFAISTILGTVAIGFANFLVVLHLWNIWERKRGFILSTLVLFTLTQITSIICAGIVLSKILVTTYFNQTLRMCGLKERSNVVMLWAPGLLFEFITFIILCFSALRTPRSARTPLTTVLHQNGLLYFSVLFILRFANSALAVLAPLDLIFIATFFVWAGTTLTVTRMVLRLRKLSVQRELGGVVGVDEKSVSPVTSQVGCNSLELQRIEDSTSRWSDT